MTIKNILVAYNGSQASNNALILAQYMMDKYDAHLTGILTFGPSQITGALAPWMSKELEAAIFSNEQLKKQEIRADFNARITPEHADRVSFITAKGDADASLLEEARVYDLVVIGQYDAKFDTRHLTAHPDTIALHSGRPVLIVPKEFDVARINEHAVLAWDGGRSAARAIGDALDVIETKSKVTVVTIGDGEAPDTNRIDRIVRHLETHGVHPGVRIIPRSRKSIANVLLEEVEAQGAGLLIMGAYEHSKFSEDLWGGVTNKVLKNIKVPVLMSH
jgi:nucleotide-binding universal stress UspA family protein